MNPAVTLATVVGAALLASAVYVAWQVDKQTVERGWRELVALMWHRRAWWLGPLAVMLVLIAALLLATTQPGCAARVYEMF